MAAQVLAPLRLHAASSVVIQARAQPRRALAVNPTSTLRLQSTFVPSSRSLGVQRNAVARLLPAKAAAGRVQMGYNNPDGEELSDGEWQVLGWRGVIMAAVATTFLAAPGWMLNKAIPSIGNLFKDPRLYPAVWSYADQATASAVRVLPSLVNTIGAILLGSSMIDFFIARAQSYEGLKFKIVGDIVTSTTLALFMGVGLAWNAYPRSDAFVVIMSVLRILWDSHIWNKAGFAL